MFQTKVVEKIKTHFVFSNFFPPDIRAVCEIMRKNIVERRRPQTTIWRMRIACWIPKATDIHPQYVTLIAFPLKQWLLLFFFFTLDAGLLAISQYSGGPATGHLDTGFSWFPCVYKQMLRWFPRHQVATTCFSCSPPDLNLVLTNFMFCVHVT